MGDPKSIGSIPDKRLQSLDYDQFCDLLGGANWSSVYELWVLAGLSPLRQKDLSSFGSYFSSPAQFLFPADDRGLFPLEAFWLKWNLFLGLIRRIQAIHRKQQKPLLDISPYKVKVSLPAAIEDHVPVRWRFLLSVDELGPAAPFEYTGMPPALAKRLYTPPEKPQHLYIAPVSKGYPMGHEETVTVLIRSLERIRGLKNEALRAIIETSLLSENIGTLRHSENDVYVLDLHLSDQSGPAIRIWASHPVRSDRGLLLKGTTDPLSQTAAVRPPLQACPFLPW